MFASTSGPLCIASLSRNALSISERVQICPSRRCRYSVARARLPIAGLTVRAIRLPVKHHAIDGCEHRRCIAVVFKYLGRAAPT